jgi:plastocyanin
MNRVHVGAALAIAAAVVIALAFALGPLQPAGNPPLTSTPEVHLTCRTVDPDRPCVYVPDEIAVRPGTTVRWTNDEDVFHTVTSTDSAEVLRPSGLFDETVSQVGDTFEFEFATPGTYHYYCQVHAEFMTGMIVVRA